MGKERTIHTQQDMSEKQSAEASSLEQLLEISRSEGKAFRSDLDRLLFLLRAWNIGQNALLNASLQGQTSILNRLEQSNDPDPITDCPGLQIARLAAVRNQKLSSGQEFEVSVHH
ncbi:MAG: hypothetical protein JXA25_00710 [Anaerolineales bacterium]|nr:hypothetical protein [Anaerolineales bacterium]